MRRHIVILLILSLPAISALLIPGGFTSHDLTHHIVRQTQMHQLLAEGQFPPRWSAYLNNGYGYPVFLFNYPLPALIGEVFHHVGFTFSDSVQAVLLLSLPISAIGMYLYIKSWLGNTTSAILGSLFYLYAPIRFLNVYVSAALGNAVALAIVPFVFYSIAANRKIVGALFLAALITSHNVTALMFFPIFVVFAVFAKRMRTSLPIFALGLSLSAFFWLPALVEKQYIQYDQLLPNFWTDHFATVRQLIRSPWGYGLSVPGPNDGLSFQIGLAHLFVVCLSVLFLPFSHHRPQTIFALCLFIFAIFLILPASTFLWNHLPLLSLVQFPPRFLIYTVFAASLSVAILRPSRSFSLLLILLVLYANRNHLAINQVFDPGDDYYLTNQSTTTTFNEHLPIGADTPSKPAASKFSFLSGSGTVTYTTNISHHVIVTLTTTDQALVQFNQYYFPGWTYILDGQPLPASPSLPSFSTTQGTHTFVAHFGHTPIRLVADLTSLVSFILLLLLGVRSFRTYS